MRNLFLKLWADDAGVVYCIEILICAVLLGISLVVGVSALEGAVNSELVETANAILAINQGYFVKAQSHCKAYNAGWGVTDTYNPLTFVAYTENIVSVNQIICP
jgi:hypothetical protein